MKGQKRLNSNLRQFLIIVLTLVCFGLGKDKPVLAATSDQFTFQARVLSKDRETAPSGSYSFRFGIYDSATAGIQLWQESVNGVEVDNGKFTVTLGANSSLNGVDFSSNNLYLLIEFDSDGNGSYDQSFSERLALSSVPVAQNTKKLGGKSESDFASLAEDEIITGAYTFQNSVNITGTANAANLHVTGETTLMSSLNGVLKANNGLIQTATAGTDYQGVITWGDGLKITANSASVDYNTTNLKISSDQINTIQDIAITASPTFANLTDSGLTATRVTYAGTAGILQDSASMTFDTTNGLKLAAGSASALNLSSTAGTTVGGILFGTDTTLYRSAANTLTTDDTLTVGAALNVTGTTTLATALTGVLRADSGVVSVGTADGDYQQVITWGDGLGYLGGTASVDYNTTNLKITASQLDTIQSIATTASPTFAGLALGSGNLTMTGSLGTTGARLTKGWFTDLEVTNAIVGSITGSSGSTTGNAATVTNGVYTTDTGTVTSTMILNGTIAAADLAAGSVTAPKLQSAAADLGAADVTVNFGNTNGAFNTNITTDGTITATTFVGALTGNADTVTTNANLTGPITSVGNATSVASQTGTGSTFVMDTSPTLVTPTLGVATATSIGIGANTLDTTEWANLDGLNQTLATTSSPTFANLTDSGLTATRVTYAGTAGILQDSASMTFDITNGLILAAGSASALQLSSTAGTAVGGILFGTDTTLYRSAANILKTDDSLVIAGTSADLLTQGDLRFYDADSSAYVGFQAPTAVSSTQLWTLPNADGGAATVLKTDGAGTLYWDTDNTAGGGSGTLDDGYNNGRTITVDAGPIVLNDSGTTTSLFDINKSGAFTGTAPLFDIDYSGSISNAADYMSFDLTGVTNAGAGNSIGINITGFDYSLQTDAEIVLASTKLATDIDFLSKKPDAAGAAFLFDTSATLSTASLFAVNNNTSRLLTLDSSGNLLPGADNVQDIGSSSYRWQDAYFSSSVNIGATLVLTDGAIKDTNGNLNFQADNDSTNYLSLSSDATDLTLTTTDAANLTITPAGTLQIGSNTTLTSAALLQWGSTAFTSPDTNLYRSAANILKTDDTLTVGAALNVVGATTLATSLTGVLTASSGVVSVGTADVTYQQPVTWGDGLGYSAGTASVDYNTTNLKITAAQLDTIQGISTAAAPTFANITDSGLTATRVTYAGTAGILQDSANMTFDTTNGLILAAGSTSALQLSSTAGTAVGGLLFGTDTNLYRSAANTLMTDDSLVVGTPNTMTSGAQLFVAKSGNFGTANDSTDYKTLIETKAHIDAAGEDVTGLLSNFHLSAASGLADSQILLRVSNSSTRQDWSLANMGSSNGVFRFGYGTTGDGSTSIIPATEIMSLTSAGQLRLYTGSSTGGVVFGDGAGAYDTNLYRNAASTLMTDDALTVTLSLTNTPLAGTGNRAVYSTATGVLTNSSSDARLKTKVASLAGGIDALNIVSQLRGVYYNWLDTEKLGSQREIGLIAQEVQPYLPEVIGTNSDGTLSLDYPKLTAVLIEATKQLQQEVAALQGSTMTAEQINTPAGKDLVLNPTSGTVLAQGSLHITGGLVVAGETSLANTAVAGTFTVKDTNVDDVELDGTEDDTDIGTTTDKAAIAAGSTETVVTIPSQGDSEYSILITWNTDIEQPYWSVIQDSGSFKVQVASPVLVDSIFRYVVIDNN